MSTRVQLEVSNRDLTQEVVNAMNDKLQSKIENEGEDSLTIENHKLKLPSEKLSPEVVDKIHSRLLKKLASQAQELTREGVHSKSGFSKNGHSKSTFSRSNAY